MRFELGTVTGEQVVQYYQTSTRIERAIQIVDHVTRDAPGICIVQSQSKPKVKYVTDIWAGTCTCPDFLFRKVICKHVIAGRIKEKLEQ